jgi:hypothetical protein
VDPAGVRVDGQAARVVPRAQAAGQEARAGRAALAGSAPVALAQAARLRPCQASRT